MSSLPTDTTDKTAIDAETEAKAKLIASPSFRQLYRSVVGSHVNEGIELLATALVKANAKAEHFERHFQRVAKEHGPSNRELDTARREWAKRGEA